MVVPNYEADGWEIPREQRLHPSQHGDEVTPQGISYGLTLSL